MAVKPMAKIKESLDDFVSDFSREWAAHNLKSGSNENTSTIAFNIK